VDDSSIPRPPGQAAARAQEGEATASSTSLKFFFLTLAAKPFFCDIIRAINLKFFYPSRCLTCGYLFFCEYRTEPKPHSKSPQKEQVTIRLSRAIYREKLYLARLSAQSVGYYPEIKLMPTYTIAGGIVNHKLIVALVVVYCRYLSWFIFRHLFIYLVYANHTLTPQG
jgi:hypothetical protein